MLGQAFRPKDCAVCGKSFIPFKSMQKVCGVRCAQKVGKQLRAKAKVDTRARKAALKTIPDLTREAQTAFNAWVRARDHDQPCISCGKPPPDLSGLHAGRDCGHYRSVGAAKHLRFHEDNAHAQCVLCNQHKSGNAVDYRIGLVDRIGVQRVEALEADNQVKKWTREELIEIRAKYKAKLKELEKNGQA